MSDANPYAAPADLITPPPVVATDDLFRREGKFLLVWDGAVLPKRCVRTNELLEKSVEGGEMLKRKLTWSPQWVWVFIVIALLVAIILSLVLQKRCTVVYGLSRLEISRFRRRKAMGWMGLLGGMGIMIYSIGAMASSNDDQFIFVLFASILVMLAGLVFISLASPIRAVGYINGWFRIKGCSKEFLDSIGPA